MPGTTVPARTLEKFPTPAPVVSVADGLVNTVVVVTSVVVVVKTTIGNDPDTKGIAEAGADAKPKATIVIITTPRTFFIALPPAKGLVLYCIEHTNLTAISVPEE